MRSFCNILIITFLILATTGCTPIEAYQAIISSDMTPPMVTGGGATEQRCIRIICNEEITITESSFNLSEEVGITEFIALGNSVEIWTTDALIPGRQYTLEGILTDLSGNSVLLTMTIYGWNPDPPVLIINEFTTKGSKRHPDAIELLVVEGGNTAGITLYDGISDDYRQRCILPSVEVVKGDYLVIHCSDIPEEFEGIPDEHQFHMIDPMGLSGNNGAISLYSSAQGDVIDAVVYSNRSSSSDSDYQGFGSSSLLYKVGQLYKFGAWDSLIPEGAISTGSMTATRSSCRNDPYSDTDSAEDWHTVPTSGASFGENNGNEIYLK